MRFIWDDDKAEENEKNHGVTFDEATEIFSDPNISEESDGMHSDDEARYIAIGLSGRRLLLVVFSEPEPNVIRVISARKAGKRAKQKYEKG
jgi:hypothetical protein